MDEYLALQLTRERVKALRAEAQHVALLREESPADGPVPTQVVQTVRRALTIRDLGRLALVSLLVMVLGIGVVGLWTAATEPRAPRAATWTSGSDLTHHGPRGNAPSAGSRDTRAVAEVSIDRAVVAKIAIHGCTGIDSPRRMAEVN